jgi:tetraacyldisaccharide 4'-kinase
MSWGNPQTPIDNLRKTLASPFALLYGLGQNLHKVAFDTGLLQTYGLSAPVISIGNITCGGTGKTPLVIDLARRLVDKGHKVGIISRGYKRKSSKSLTIVSDGLSNFAPCLEAGDEPLMIAQAVKKAVVISSADRLAAAKHAIDIYKCDLLLLDDGFQHYRLKRDLDLVLIDYADDLLNDSLLPAGRLREPIANLKRSSNIIITKVPKRFDKARMKQLEKIISSLSPRATVSTCRFVPKSICKQMDNQITQAPIKTLSGEDVFAFCGLAKPEGFISLLQDAKANIVGTKVFPDHHWYTDQDVDFLHKKLEQTKAKYLITTEKDYVKLGSSKLKNNLWFVELETEWIGQFPKALQNFVDFGHMNNQRKYRTEFPYQGSEKQFLKR